MTVAEAVRRPDLEIMDLHVGDPVVADHIIAVCPPGTYSSISVQTKGHHFRDTLQGETHQSRVIEFEPTNFQAAWHLLSIIFQKTQPTINATRAVLGVLGSEDQMNGAEALKAFKKNYKISIYVAVDGSELLDYTCTLTETTQKVVNSACIIL